MNNNEAVREKKKSKILIIVILVNLILWPTLIYLLLDSSTTDTPRTPAQMAYIAAKYAIHEHLKVPDSAEYEPFDTVSIKTDGNNTYQVQMWVKSQNLFGVKVKSEFIVTVRQEDENWRLLDLQELQ